MPRGPKGEKRPADVIGNAVHVMRIAAVRLRTRMTPTMAAGVSHKLWFMTDLAEMVEATLPKP